MLDSQTKAAVYNDMLDLLNRGHIKGALESSSGFCLVGAANRAASSAGLSDHASRLLQAEIRDEILRRYPHIRAIVNRGELHHDVTSDGGLAVIEAWNDTPWRRTRTVIKVIEELAQQADKAAKDELIAELRRMVADLKTQKAALEARIAELEAENEALRNEVSYWKKAWNGRRTKVAAADLKDASTELSELDRHLDEVLVQLTGVTVAS